jgi:hypothetical protein
VTEVADGDTIHVAPSIIINNTYRTVARPTDIDALEFTTPEGRWAEATTLTTDYSYYDHVVYYNTSHYDDPGYNDIHYYSTRNCDYSDNYIYYSYSNHYNLHYYNSIYNHYRETTATYTLIMTEATTTTYTITTPTPTTATTTMTSTVAEANMDVALLLGVIALVLGYIIARRRPWIVVAD